MSDNSISHTLDRPAPDTSPDSASSTLPTENDPAAESAKPSRLISAYVENRNQGFSLVYDYPIDTFFSVVKAVGRRRRTDLVDMLVDDVIESAHRLAPCTHYQVAEALLQCIHPKSLRKHHLLSILRTLDSRGQLLWLPAKARCDLVEAYLPFPAQPDADSPLFDYFATLLLDLAKRGSRRDTVQEHPFGRDVWLLYRITYELTRHQRRRKALEIIHTLADKGMLSKQAMQETDLSSGDFTVIAVSTTVRSCLHFGWHGRAVTLMLHVLLSETNELSDALAQLALHVLGAVIEYIQPGDFVNVVSVAILLVRRGPVGCVTSVFLQELYAAAQRLDQGPLAEALYGQIRLPRVVARFAYDPPCNGPLRWLMEHLSLKSKNAHLARELVTQVVNRQTPILLQDRGEIIALAAEQGLARPARMLWEYYSAGKDRGVVVGHARAMVRLVSVFAGMIRRREVLLEDDSRAPLAALDSQEDTSDPLAAGTVSDDTLTSVAPDSAAQSAPETIPPRPPDPPLRIDPGAEQSPPDAHLSTEPPHPSGVPAQGHPPPSGAREDLHGSAPSSEHPTEADAPLADFRGFAERVLLAFEADRTLQTATHYELNALARACFLLRRTAHGFAVFRTMLARRFVPDLRDVNVALALLAAHDPAAAARALDRMAAGGLQPDAVTLGTLIHHAAVHGDTALVAALVQRGRALGVTRFSYKTVGTLLRAALAAGGEGAKRLERVEELVEELVRGGQVPSANMGRDCVVAALRADRPAVAFRFWRELVKDRVQWDDEVAVFTRRRIAGAVRRHVEGGALEEGRARGMLVELGAERGGGRRA
ncbi:hypothetical protein B0H21DRAFT_834316 [Amylocystis lapponica]|nr:hypothetical protein B0H21DRAFT_834316 [Amylocystis lapponica]